jgi:hypothetical protein
VDAYRACVLAHLFFGVLLAGQALFWLTMQASLRQRFAADETLRLLQVVKAARWPHVIVPYRLRLPLPWVTWLIVAALLLSAGGIVHFRGGVPEGGLWWLKWALVLTVIGLQAAIARSPRPGVIRLNFYVVLATIVISAVAIR